MCGSVFSSCRSRDFLLLRAADRAEKYIDNILSAICETLYHHRFEILLHIDMAKVLCSPCFKVCITLKWCRRQKNH